MSKNLKTYFKTVVEPGGFYGQFEVLINRPYFSTKTSQPNEFLKILPYIQFKVSFLLQGVVGWFWFYSLLPFHSLTAISGSSKLRIREAGNQTKKSTNVFFFYLARCWKLSSMAGSQRQTPSLKGWFSDLKTSSTLAPWTSAQFRDDVHSCWPPKTPSQLLLSWHTLYSPFLRGSVHPGMKFFGESLSKWGQSRSTTFQVLFMTNPQSIQIYKLVLDQPSQAIQDSLSHSNFSRGESGSHLYDILLILWRTSIKFPKRFSHHTLFQ